MRDVLIVRAPQLKREGLEELRDYVVESLHQGVLVVPKGMELEVLALPEPGEENAGPDAPEEPSAVPTGRGAETMLRNMAAGTVAYPLSDWRAAGRALDRVSKLDTGGVMRNEP